MTPEKKSPWIKTFTVPWWAKNSHIQTILPTLSSSSSLKLRRERLELEDGDFIDLDWLNADAPVERIVVILHGLEGGSHSPYARRLMSRCHAYNIHSVVHHHRGCSGENNRLAHSYHSGQTEDIQFTLSYIRGQHPDAKIYAVGYSLGGNALAKYLGEQGESSVVDRAVVVSAPLDLAACAKRLETGFSTIYQSHLIKKLQQKAVDKIATPKLKAAMPIDTAQVKQLKTFHKFDDQVTAPLHGFKDVHDYYAQCSGIQFLKSIEIPTLIIHSEDDPFMSAAVIPQPDQLADCVEYELYPFGGHVGFIIGGSPLRPSYFLENRIASYLNI